jgi:hypothetical protein
MYTFRILRIAGWCERRWGHTLDLDVCGWMVLKLVLEKLAHSIWDGGGGDESSGSISAWISW